MQKLSLRAAVIESVPLVFVLRVLNSHSLDPLVSGQHLLFEYFGAWTSRHKSIVYLV
jgi:hypothetical protein